MDRTIAGFNEFLAKTFLDPSLDLDSKSIDEFVTLFAESPLWLARARVVQYSLDNTKLDSQTKSEVLDFYKANAATAELNIEAARAAAVFEEPDVLFTHISKAQDLLNFHPEISGVQVRFTKHQTEPRTRIGCLATTASSVSHTASDRVIEVVKLNTTEDLIDPPQFIHSKEEQESTSLLSNLEYAILLLLSRHTELSNPASTTTVVNEQALPFIRRVTETSEFQKIDFSVSAYALFQRSVLEMKDINELERGTVQLMKLSKALHATAGNNLNLDLLHLLIPLPVANVDDSAARRLVAMSDFSNAIPFYKILNRPLDVAVCLVATGANDEALRVLSAPELSENPQALLLRGDLSSDENLWMKAWTVGHDPRAKSRLAQKAVANNQLDQALGHLDDLLGVQPRDHDALKLAASVAMSLQKYTEAAGYLRRCLAVNDDDTRGWSNLATVLLQMEQPGAAHNAIKQAIRVNQNQEPDLPTYANYVALSAQLGLYDDVLVGLNRLVDAVDRGAQDHIARVSGVLPRLVAHYVKTEYTGTVPQVQLTELFTQKLPLAIAPNDAMLYRLTGQVEIWAHRYQAGLQSLNKSLDILFSETSAGTTDARELARIQLYSKELLQKLETYGDKEGRIEGSKAFPNWQARKAVIEKKLASFS